MGVQNHKEVCFVRAQIRRILNLNNVDMRKPWSKQPSFDPLLRSINDCHTFFKSTKFNFYSVGMIRKLITVILQDSKRNIDAKEKDYQPATHREKPAAPRRKKKYFNTDAVKSLVSAETEALATTASVTESDDREEGMDDIGHASSQTNVLPSSEPGLPSVPSQISSTKSGIGIQTKVPKLIPREAAGCDKPEPRPSKAERSEAVTWTRNKAAPGIPSRSTAETVDSSARGRSRSITAINNGIRPTPDVSTTTATPERTTTVRQQSTSGSSGSRGVVVKPAPKPARIMVEFVKAMDDFTTVAEFALSLCKRKTLRELVLTINNHIGYDLNIYNGFLVWLPVDEYSRYEKGHPRWRLITDVEGIIKMFLKGLKGRTGIYLTEHSLVSTYRKIDGQSISMKAYADSLTGLLSKNTLSIGAPKLSKGKVIYKNSQGRVIL